MAGAVHAQEPGRPDHTGAGLPAGGRGEPQPQVGAAAGPGPGRRPDAAQPYSGQPQFQADPGQLQAVHRQQQATHGRPRQQLRQSDGAEVGEQAADVRPDPAEEGHPAHGGGAAPTGHPLAQAGGGEQEPPRAEAETLAGEEADPGREQVPEERGEAPGAG